VEKRKFTPVLVCGLVVLTAFAVLCLGLGGISGAEGEQISEKDLKISRNSFSMDEREDTDTEDDILNTKTEPNLNPSQSMKLKSEDISKIRSGTNLLSSMLLILIIITIVFLLINIIAYKKGKRKKVIRKKKGKKKTSSPRKKRLKKKSKNITKEEQKELRSLFREIEREVAPMPLALMILDSISNDEEVGAALPGSSINFIEPEISTDSRLRVVEVTAYVEEE